MGWLIESMNGANLHEARTLKRPSKPLLIAIWQFLTVLPMLYFLLMYFGLGMGQVSATDSFGFFWMLGTTLAGILGYIVVPVAGGIGLMKGYKWGRKLCIAHAILSLALFPIGTVIGILSLRYLMRKDIREYFSTSSESFQYCADFSRGKETTGPLV